MQLKSLEIFLAVIKYGSFSHAAEKLFTVQSNITNHIKKLEQELGCELLFRQNPIQPTSVGIQLQHYAEQILKLHQQAKQHIQDGGIDLNTPLRIGSMQTTAAVRLPELFQNLLNHYPNMPFHLHTDPSRDLMDMVSGGLLDCAFIAHHKPIEGFYNVPMWTEQLVLLTPLSATQPLAYEYLIQQRFIGFRQGCAYRRSIELFLQSHDLPTTHIVEVGSLDGIVSCVSLGMGLAILPLSYVKQSYHYTKIQAIPIALEFAPVNTYLITNRAKTWNSNLKVFVHMLKDLMK